MRHPAQIDRDEIHRYAADDRRRRAIDEHWRARARAARIAVAVADRRHADGHVLRTLPGRGVTDALALAYTFDRNQLGRQGHRRLEAEIRAGFAFDHGKAVQQAADPDPVVI